MDLSSLFTGALSAAVMFYAAGLVRRALAKRRPAPHTGSSDSSR